MAVKSGLVVSKMFCVCQLHTQICIQGNGAQLSNTYRDKACDKDMNQN